MRGFIRFAVLALACVLFLPAVARAQSLDCRRGERHLRCGASRRDGGSRQSGSDREDAEAVTDGAGQYRIVNCCPASTR